MDFSERQPLAGIELEEPFPQIGELIRALRLIGQLLWFLARGFPHL